RSFRGGLVEFEMEPVVTTALRDLAQSRGTTLFVVWLAIVRSLLYRVAGAVDAIVGTPVAGREHPDLAPLVGFFVNMLPLRFEVTGELPFEEVMDRARAATERGLVHQMYPYDRLVEELGLRRDMGRNPLFDVVLSVRDREPSPVPAGLVAAPFPMAARTSKFD